jgi:hypothetical protein
MRVDAITGVRLLRRILRRFRCALSSRFEMCVGYLQIMFRRHGWAVADPGTYRVHWKLFC